jgi:glucose-1-phosphate adenylyltransferase
VFLINALSVTGGRKQGSAMLDIHLLGDFRLFYNGNLVTTITTSRLQSLLAYLVLHRDTPQPRQRIASRLWPDSSESQARTNLRNLIHLLRQTLPEADNYLCMDGSTLQWQATSAFLLDVAEMEKAISNGDFETAVALYRGDLLPDCYDEWIIDKREQLRQMYADALAKLIHQKEIEHDYHTAIEYARSLIHHEPLQEQSYRELMRLYALGGDRTGIVRAYNECAKVLQNELSVEPSVGTHEMYKNCQTMISMGNSTIETSEMDSSIPKRRAGTNNSFHETLTLILGGGRGRFFSLLMNGALKPALPFAGKYRVIDFVLSNVVNSNLSPVAILTQNHPKILIKHLSESEFRMSNGQTLPKIQIWEPSIERTGHKSYLASGNAVYQNREFIRKENCETLMILAADQVYHQDYRDLLRFHQEKGADLTIVVRQIPAEDARRFGIVTVNENQRIVNFVEKPSEFMGTLASTGIYVFNTSFILDCLEKDALNASSEHDFGKHIIPSLINSSKVYAYQSNGYWMDINTPETYWKTNLALLDQEPTLNLHNPSWILNTPTNNLSPTDIRPNGKVVNCLVTEGCVIEGEIVHSILSEGVRIEKGAVVHDSVIFQNTIIYSGATIQACLIGDNVEIGSNAHIGVGDDLIPNQTEPYLTSGLTIIGKESRIPANASIGRNCCVDEHFTYHDNGRLHLASGKSIKRSA